MVRITGADAVTAKLSGKLSEQAVKNVGTALFAGGQEIEAEAKHMITEGSVSGKNHVPSLPGEPPNRDTGVLDTNIETTQPAPLHVEVSSNAPYAVALEFGTSKMEARPYMGPATSRKREAVVQLVREAVNRATKA